ncbi:MAG: glycosyltransferase family 2 protein [Euryarchaeota archaeon]|nr:glycosyltransferase family 2 protein [Euryarchaeota archaeon]
MTAIILPTKNERESIRETIRRIRSVCPDRIVVVDGHSADGTAGIARQMGATVISDNGKGKGDALRVAFEYVGDDVVFVDVDDTYPVERIPEFIDALKDYDLVIGERTEFVAGSLPLLLRIGDWISMTAFLVLYGVRLDNLSGFRGITRDAISQMKLESDGFGIETEITAKSVRLGLRIRKIPITYSVREGDSKFNPIRDGIAVVCAMVRYRFSRGLKQGI